MGQTRTQITTINCFAVIKLGISEIHFNTTKPNKYGLLLDLYKNKQFENDTIINFVPLNTHNTPTKVVSTTQITQKSSSISKFVEHQIPRSCLGQTHKILEHIGYMYTLQLIVQTSQRIYIKNTHEFVNKLYKKYQIVHLCA